MKITMKKLITIILTVVALLSIHSCDTYAQTYVGYDNTIVYEYSYGGYPVRYVDGIAYYYCLTNDIWSWIVLPRTYYPYIVRHTPMRYVRPVPRVFHNEPRTMRLHPGRTHNGHEHNMHHHTPNRGGVYHHNRPNRGCVGHINHGGRERR